MKKYFYLLLLALVPAMTFTACGSDDDNEPEFNPGDVKFSKPTLTETSKQLILTYNESYEDLVVNIVETYEFDGDVLVKVTFSETFPNEAMAQEFIDDLNSDPEESLYSRHLTRNGRTVTYDATSDYKGKTKEEIRKFLQYRVDNWDRQSYK